MAQTIAFTGHAREDARLAVTKIVRFFLIAALAAAAVVPHSFQLVEAALFLLTTALALTVLQNTRWLNQVLLTYFLGVIVTAIYIWVGYTNGAPRAASNQILFVYIVAPAMWIVMSAALFQILGLSGTVRLLIWLTWAAVASVAAFFYLFLVFGKQAVVFLTAEANVNVQGGYAAATILVYGSLIFLAGALFAEPNLVRNRYARILLPAGVLIAAITSGRSALILAVPIGFATGAFLRSRVRDPRLSGERKQSFLLPIFLLVVITAAVLVLMDFLLAAVDLRLIFASFYRELLSGGGSERTEQSLALWQGFIDSYGLGVGHGVGIPYIRNFDFPWRYEVMPLATLLRVGVLGSLVYLSTFILYGNAFAKRLAARDLTPEDIYMMGGFVPVALAVATNPYIESFVFQWMYFLPVLSIGARGAVRPAA